MTESSHVTPAIRRAADLLLRASVEHRLLSALPDDVAPRTRAEAYAAQAAWADLTGEAMVGWKIAATSTAGQRHINVPGPLAGRVLAGRLHQDGDAVSLAGNSMRLIELEFMFRLGETLPPRTEAFSLDEVTAAVTDLHLGAELPDSRFADPTTVGDLQLVADNACGGVFVVGPVAPAAWRQMDLSDTRVFLDIDGPTGYRQVEGRGANVLGNPLFALTWLVNELSRYGIPVEAGQLVTTGTCCVPAPIVEGDRLTARFEGLGAVSFSLSDA